VIPVMAVCQWLAAERDNLLAAAAYAGISGRRVPAYLIPAALAGVEDAWRGDHWEQVLAEYQQALAEAIGAGDEGGQTRALMLVARGIRPPVACPIAPDTTLSRPAPRAENAARRFMSMRHPAHSSRRGDHAAEERSAAQQGARQLAVTTARSDRPVRHAVWRNPHGLSNDTKRLRRRALTRATITPRDHRSGSAPVAEDSHPAPRQPPRP
jgi:hypothetical protein